MWRSSPPVRLRAGTEREEHEAASCCKIGRRHDKAQCFQAWNVRLRLPTMTNCADPNEEANSLSKEDVIEIEGIVREAMPNAIFKVEMLASRRMRRSSRTAMIT